MTEPQPIVLSASRRTDIPAFYMDWFMAGIEQGSFEVVNPYNQRIFAVPAAVDRVHSIVFWSKNYAPFLHGDYGERLRSAGYPLFFLFTVNSASALLEPGLPGLSARLAQMAELCRRFGPQSVVWRFDPICFFETADAGPGDNLADFSRIADAAAESGIGRCITSFMDHYAKIARRTERLTGFRFLDPSLARKAALLAEMGRSLARRGIELSTCCEKALMEALPAQSPVRAGACIDSELLTALFGGRLSLRRDSGQRKARGCLCRVSRDIGSYDRHPCFHNCLFCYANPAPPPESAGP